MSSARTITPGLGSEESKLISDPPAQESKRPTVCLVGAPNAGKTALMNALTGGGFQTANYPGVTVTLSRGKSKAEFGPEVALVDLPGVQSAVAPSPEEELSCKVIEGTHHSVRPDALILVIDSTQLERHLKLAGFAARARKPMVIALTMMDLLARADQSVNVKKLSAALGVPVVPVDGRTGWGVLELMASLHQAIDDPSRQPNALAGLPDEPIASYAAVREIIESSGAVRKGNRLVLAKDSVTARIDRVVLHRYLGFPVFLIILMSLFAAIFWAAQPFMDWIEAGFAAAGQLTLDVLPQGVISRFIAEGIFGGVGAVAVFFPQIVILFFLMTLLEDSGYLARGAALVDKPLSYLGLHGRSFVPMLSGYACAIPAVLAARTIPSKRERLLTIWILPLMSCSARLPVYALLLAALLPGSPWKAGLALSSVYVASLLASALTAGLISRFILRRRASSMLAMELPVYRKPLIRPTIRMTWSRSSAYLKRAGGPIVVISAIIWLVSNFGFGARQEAAPGAPAPSFISVSELDHSFAAQGGQIIEPLLHPMGIDWRVGVGLISAFAAREVFVSSLAIVFHVAGDEESQQEGLLEQMRTATFAGGAQRVFTPASIIGLMVFFFFSLQCLSTVAVVRSETNSWKIAGLQLLFYTGLGYLLSTATVQGLRFFGVA
ncbi:MAG TPA: ferrous iron transporter B [Blastocatellia bacterium]|jgi:ferrous iron transport protein B|nr:ferrous iron transporter B [Blastocatellia bacterium]